MIPLMPLHFPRFIAPKPLTRLKRHLVAQLSCTALQAPVDVLLDVTGSWEGPKCPLGISSKSGLGMGCMGYLGYMGYVGYKPIKLGISRDIPQLLIKHPLMAHLGTFGKIGLGR